MEALFTPATLLLMAWALAMAAFHYRFRKRTTSKGLLYSKQEREDVQNNNVVSSGAVREPLTAPGPSPLPIIGNLHQLAKYEQNPCAGFTELADKYGSVYSLQMGSTPAVVVSSIEGLKEVLITKGTKFDGRPDFYRWNLYFDGDRQQSLALCDWSDLQKTRRSIIRSFLLMKSHSNSHGNLDVALINEMDSLMAEFDKTSGTPVLAKIPIQWCAMNVFLKYMCDVKFDYSNTEFQDVVKKFDLIFEDINTGHPTDFLPWLAPLFWKHLHSVKQLATGIRGFILEHIIKHYDGRDNFDKSKNVMEGLLANYTSSEEQQVSMDWNNLLFALEDLLGGSSAIGNVMLRVLAFVAQSPEVQQRLQKEVDQVIGPDCPVSIDHRRDMPYAEATIMEALRHTSSPIVPHVANESTTLGDFKVEKGTVVILNNYALNMSEEHWDKPQLFNPERFIKDGAFYKPANFLPFSTDSEDVCLPVGRLAVVGDGFNMVLNQRRQG